jgi:hypothetical protein
LTMSPDRVITLTRPDGVVHFVGSTVDRVPGSIRGVHDRPVAQYVLRCRT